MASLLETDVEEYRGNVGLTISNNGQEKRVQRANDRSAWRAMVSVSVTSDPPPIRHEDGHRQSKARQWLSSGSYHFNQSAVILFFCSRRSTCPLCANSPVGSIFGSSFNGSVRIKIGPVFYIVDSHTTYHLDHLKIPELIDWRQQISWNERMKIKRGQQHRPSSNRCGSNCYIGSRCCWLLTLILQETGRASSAVIQLKRNLSYWIRNELPLYDNRSEISAASTHLLRQMALSGCSHTKNRKPIRAHATESLFITSAMSWSHATLWIGSFVRSVVRYVRYDFSESAGPIFMKFGTCVRNHTNITSETREAQVKSKFNVKTAPLKIFKA